MQFPARANEGEREQRMTKNEGGDRGGAVIVLEFGFLIDGSIKKLTRF